MKIRVQYTAQMRAIAGAIEEQVELPPGGTLASLMEQVAARWGQDGARHLLTADGQALASLLIVVNESAVPAGELRQHRLSDNDIVTFYPPIAGG